jgi:transcriptional regulator with XRE-family HTH domain
LVSIGVKEKQRPMSLKLTLPEAIRSIRVARQMKTAEFARQIGVAQSIVSRYESGGRSPGKRVLLKLMLMARDAEKETIKEALSKVCRGEPIKDSEARRIALSLAQEDELLKQVVSYVNLSNRGRFLSLSAGIAESETKIDDSLNKILSIWFTSEHTPDVVRHFRDAARFLEIALVPGAGETIEPVVRALSKLGLIAPTDEASEPTSAEASKPQIKKTA